MKVDFFSTKTSINITVAITYHLNLYLGNSTQQFVFKPISSLGTYSILSKQLANASNEQQHKELTYSWSGLGRVSPANS